MQGCLQLMCNLDYTRNRRQDLTMQCLFIHSLKLRNNSDFKECVTQRKNTTYVAADPPLALVFFMNEV